MSMEYTIFSSPDYLQVVPEGYKQGSLSASPEGPM